MHQAHHDLLADYGPEAWGEVVAQVAARASARRSCSAPGTERGNEVLAQAAARLDAADGRQLHRDRLDDDGLEVTRVRWGGSLLEEATLDRRRCCLTTVAPHAFDGSRARPAGRGAIGVFEPSSTPRWPAASSATASSGWPA